MISALGNTSSPSLVLDAVDMVGVKMRDQNCVDVLWIDPGGREIGRTTCRTAAPGESYCPPVPVSIRTSFYPVLTTRGVNGVGMPVGSAETNPASAFCTSANGALRTNFSSMSRNQCRR